MNKHLVLIGLVALSLIVVTSVAMANSGNLKPAASFAETVRQATEQFKDVGEAEHAGYGLLHGCVNGPQEGAMGIHFANGGWLATVRWMRCIPKRCCTSRRMGNSSLWALSISLSPTTGMRSTRRHRC